MRPDSDAIGTKKARKKPKAPQVIAPEVWLAIEKACCAGLGYSAAAREFGVSVFAVMARSKRNKWPVGNRIQRRVEALQEARYKARERYKPYEQQRNSNAQVTEAIAETWTEKGEEHRSIVYGMTNTALKKVAKNPPPLESWSYVERADKAARRACGLEDSEEIRNINIGMQLINQRLEIIIGGPAKSSRLATWTAAAPRVLPKPQAEWPPVFSSRTFADFCGLKFFA